MRQMEVRLYREGKEIGMASAPEGSPMRVAVGGSMGLLVTEIELSFAAVEDEQKPLVDERALRQQIAEDNRAGLNELEQRRELARQVEQPTTIEATANQDRDENGQPTAELARTVRVRRLGTPTRESFP